MRRYTRSVSTRTTSQTEPVLGREADMAENHAGGYVFTVDDWGRLDRFLILGSDAPTYYVGQRKLTVENAQCVKRCIDADGPRVVKTIVDVSVQGRAPKNDPALFALAMCMKLGNAETRKAAQDAVTQVARIGTHLFNLAEAVKAFGGWGRGTRRAFANWYTSKTPDQLAYQIVKYQQRNGWSHADVLRKCHPKGFGPATPTGAVLAYAVGKTSRGPVPRIIAGVGHAKRAARTHQVVDLINEYGLPRECIPSEWLKDDIGVWEALLMAGKGMPLTAMIRNLGKMSAIGLTVQGSAASRHVRDVLSDVERLKAARIHPLAVLQAMMVYKQGHGVKGNLTWDADTDVLNALDAAFYSTFGNVEPTNKRIMLALDVSGSMGWNAIAGMNITPRVGSAAMSMITAAAEARGTGSTEVVGFDTAAPRVMSDFMVR